MKTNRRKFIGQLGKGAIGAAAMTALPKSVFAWNPIDNPYAISLAQFSFASEFFAGAHDTLNFPARAKRDFGLDIVEYVSMFFADKGNDPSFFKTLKKRTDDLGVANNLIMVDDENIADLDPTKRAHAVESHYKWVDAAKILNCNSIRVNLGSLDQTGDATAIAEAAMEGYSRLLDYGTKNELDIIVENHVGNSCNGKWLAGIMKAVNNPRAGVLPDFGNFCINRTKPETMDIAGFMNTKCLEEYDKYLGMEELMPYAKGVSAKTHKFDNQGDETEIDFARMFDIIKKSGFKGVVGIEYEGGLLHGAGVPGYLPNEAGIVATKKLIEKYA
tara:strand:+ start:631 stop:1620 length:990 start_codon:yes stop_codon:yes gene_type:complete